MTTWSQQVIQLQHISKCWDNGITWTQWTHSAGMLLTIQHIQLNNIPCLLTCWLTYCQQQLNVPEPVSAKQQTHYKGILNKSTVIRIRKKQYTYTRHNNCDFNHIKNESKSTLCIKPAPATQYHRELTILAMNCTSDRPIGMKSSEKMTSHSTTRQVNAQENIFKTRKF